MRKFKLLKILNIVGIILINILIFRRINRYKEEEKILGENVEVSASLPYYVHLDIKPEKRIPPTNNDALEIDVDIRAQGGSTSYHDEVLNSDDQGEASVTPLPTSQVTHDHYDVAVKGLSHLRKVYENKEIGPGNTVELDLTYDPLLAGDSHPTSDNYINGMDLSYEVLNLYTNDMRGDLNRDNTINSLDLSILITNLYKYGDE